MTPKFSISVLAYQNVALTKKCLESVMANSQEYELILTDNGCKDGTAEYFDQLAAAHPHIRVVHNPVNLGFIEPNRIAFRMATAPFHVLLNNDTVVQPGWLDSLHNPFDHDPNCALVGPAGTCCQLRGDFRGEVGPRFEYLEGSMLMMRRDFVAAVEPNLFAPELDGAYGEDSWLSLVMREAGHNLHRVPMNWVHYRGATSAMVPQAMEWERKNHQFLQQRFRRYMVNHRFNYPTIVKRTAAYGDVLLITPILRALRKLRPASPIMVETIIPHVLDGNPDVSHVGRSIPQHLDGIFVNLDNAYEMKTEINIVDAYAEIAGLKPGQYDRITRLYPCGGDDEWAVRTLTDNGNDWIAVHPGPTGWSGKNWPNDRWAQVIDDLLKTGRNVVLVGNDVAGFLPSTLDMRGKTTVAQLGSLLRRCRMLVTVDNFVLHAAQAVGCPVVGLFGVTTGKYIFSDGSPCVAVESDPANPSTGLRHRSPGTTFVEDKHEVMKTITVEMVLRGIAKILIP